MRHSFVPIVTMLLVGSCATVDAPPNTVEAPKEVETAQKEALAALPEIKRFKRKIAIGRFTNETNYGRALLTGGQLDALGRQTSDILSARLIETGRFIVLERPELAVVDSENALTGANRNIVGADTLIVGSLTEFGRATEGERGFLSSTKNQIARAKVEIRLVDPTTTQAYFAASGAGEASTESGTVAGFGSKASYDGTLNDRAISAAISDMINELVIKLEERPWRTDILKVEGENIFVSGGERQGVKVGDRLAVMAKGDTVKSGQSGFDIELPATKIAEIEIIRLFGTSETNEGAVARIVSGAISQDRTGLFVGEL